MEILKDSSCEIEDSVGKESCVSLGKEIGEIEKMKEGGDVCNRLLRQMSESKRREKKKFPPPIPLLARTENLAPHMPWILRRYYTSDGRLIIDREKVRHHEYFQAYRSGGRLTLWLIPLDDVVYSTAQQQHVDNEVESEEADTVNKVESEEDDKGINDPTVEYDGEGIDPSEIDPTVVEDEKIDDELKSDPTVEDKLVIPGSSSVTAATGVCCNFSRDHEMTSFMVSMPAVRPVYI